MILNGLVGILKLRFSIYRHLYIPLEPYALGGVEIGQKGSIHLAPI